LRVSIALRTKPAEATLPVEPPKPDRSRGMEPDEERCLGEKTPIKIPLVPKNEDMSNEFKHGANDSVHGSGS
jgi:hypothetical protein